MNKNALIVISLGAAAFLTALFYIYFRQVDKKTNPAQDSGTMEQTETDEMTNITSQNQESLLQSGLNENQIIYQITGGEVTYGADKQFFGKDAENVIGTSTDVQGTGYWDKSTNEITVSAAVNLSGLTTGNDRRDSEIQPLFTDKMATFRIEPTKVDIKMGEEFQQDMTGNLIINGVSKMVTFKTKGMVNDQSFSAEGVADIKMSDFGITSPSLAGVFTVADELPITFKVMGDVVAGNN